MPYKDKVSKAKNFRLWYSIPENKKKWKQQKRELGIKYKKLVFSLLGKVCKRCGFSDTRALQIDHINGGGCKERKATGHSGYSIYRRVLANPEKYQILCANCNWIKRIEEGEVPDGQ